MYKLHVYFGFLTVQPTQSKPHSNNCCYYTIKYSKTNSRVKDGRQFNKKRFNFFLLKRFRSNRFKLLNFESNQRSRASIFSKQFKCLPIPNWNKHTPPLHHVTLSIIFAFSIIVFKKHIMQVFKNSKRKMKLKNLRKIKSACGVWVYIIINYHLK